VIEYPIKSSALEEGKTMIINEEERKRILYHDYQPLTKITEAMRVVNSSRKFTGGVRINYSQYRTTEEYFEHREKSLGRKLP
jgi:hypothetical protein